jgi:hypothetical protein
MNKVFTLLLLFSVLVISAQAQTVLCENFNSYDSTGGPNFHGWQLSYSSQFSFYTSTQSSGPSGPNSYKFGVDSATAITPDITGADHISFWMKGNASTGGSLANGAFYIYETNDGTNYTLIDMISPIPAGVPQTKQYALSAGTTMVKFFYDKDSGNVAFDDFCATIGTGINDLSHSNIVSIYPNPTKGLATVNINNVSTRNATLTLHNVLGKELRTISLKGTESTYTFDLSSFQDGIYFVKFKSEQGESTQRIFLRK